MENEKRLIDGDELLTTVLSHFGVDLAYYGRDLQYCQEAIEHAPTVDAIPATEIKAYLQARLDEWESLGDRKWEPANMWGYNFIMACFDDLERRYRDE